MAFVTETGRHKDKSEVTPPSQKFSYRALRVYALLAAAIAIAGGGTLVLFGIDAVAVVVGTEYPHIVSELEKSAQQILETAPVTFDTWCRLLGCYWVSAGLMLLWITPSIGTSTAWFRFIHVAFMGHRQCTHHLVRGSTYIAGMMQWLLNS